MFVEFFNLHKIKLWSQQVISASTTPNKWYQSQVDLVGIIRTKVDLVGIIRTKVV